jgi:DegV family protein with EDD domain
MEKIGIVTDEAADLPKDIVEKYQIAIVPVKLDWPEIENLPGENTFQKMRELEKSGIKSFGKTSQPSPKDFLEKYKHQFERFDKILCITLTSKLSGTYNSAIQARDFLTPEEQKRVFVIDSLNASCGQSIIILKTIDLIEDGKEAEEIAKELEKLVSQIHLFVILKDPKWLEASGRISHLVANLLRRMAQAGIRPLLTFKNGRLVPAGIKTGAKDIPTALFKKFETGMKKLREDKQIRVIITHGDDLEGAQRLEEMIKKDFQNAEVSFINIINNVVGGPTGPNTLAIAWSEI